MRQLMQQQQQQHVRPLKPKKTVDRMAFALLPFLLPALCWGPEPEGTSDGLPRLPNEQ